MKKLCFFDGSFFKKILLTFRIFDELQIGQRFIIFEKVRCRGQLLSKLRAVEVATSFHRLDQLNSKDTKTVVSSTIQYFEDSFQKKFLVKVWCFLVHPPQNYGPVKLLRNWTVTIFYWPIFSNFTNIRHLV